MGKIILHLHFNRTNCKSHRAQVKNIFVFYFANTARLIKDKTVEK